MFVDTVAALEAMVDDCAAGDVEGEPGVDLGVGLGRLQGFKAKLAALEARATVSFDASGDWASDGSASAAAWLAYRRRVSGRVARKDVRLARRLRSLPATAAALAAGEIGVEHAERLAWLNTGTRVAAFARDEEILVGHARTLEWPEFDRAIAYWRQLSDPDGSEGDAAHREEQRRLHLSEGLDGTGILDGLLSPVAHATVSESLRRIEQELFEADWAEAKTRLGDAVSVDALCRTASQRRHDALWEMAIRAQTAPTGGKRPQPLVTILVGYETFVGRVCQLADGTVVTPGTVASQLDDAVIERAVFSAPDRVEAASETRTFVGAARRAIELQDQFCTHPGCHTPAERCQGDHIIPYEHDGPTVPENGTMLCARHHRYRHRTEPNGSDSGPPPHGDDDEPPPATAP